METFHPREKLLQSQKALKGSSATLRKQTIHKSQEVPESYLICKVSLSSTVRTAERSSQSCDLPASFEKSSGVSAFLGHHYACWGGFSVLQ